jgi:hypothetical protein
MFNQLHTLGDRWKRHCGQKKKHANQEAAEQERQRMERVERTRFNTYQCQACGQWHIGHKGETYKWQS